MDVSFQLYSAREFTPWDRVLGMLADAGYTQVEGFGPLYEDAAAFRGLLDKHGLAMPSGHFSVESLKEDAGGVFETARTLGIERIFAPYLIAEKRPGSVDGWKAISGQIATIGKAVRDEGFAFGWHNHDFEFRALADGTVPMAIMLDAAGDIDWEADIAWIVRGGADPLEWIDRYGGRITTAHVKDIAPSGENEDEDGWADVGHGTVDWPKIMAALRKAGTDLFVMEHDKPSDVDRFAKRSMEAFRNL